MPPRPRPPVLRAVRTSEALDALRSRLDEFDGGARQHGRDYYQSGAVRRVWSEADHLVKAQVAGGEDYAVTLTYARGNWNSRCTCPVSVDCKHAYAAGLAWMAAVEAGVRDGRDPDEADALAARSAMRLPPSLVERPAAPTPPAADPSELENEVARWLRALPDPEVASAVQQAFGPEAITAIAGLRVRISNDGAWIVETRPASDKPWKAATKLFLVELARARPADFAARPASEAALGAALAAEYRIGQYSSTSRLTPSAVLHLLRTPAALEGVVLPDGRPFSVEPGPLVPEARLIGESADRLAVSLTTPDGRPAAGARLVSQHPRPLYLFENRLWHGPPPLPSETLPLAALDEPRLRRRLRATGLRLPDGVLGDTREITLRPRLRCWLVPTPDGVEREFRAVLTAVADDPPCRRIWSGDAGWLWTRDGAPPPRRVGEPQLDFDLAAAQGAANALGGLRVFWDGWAEHWSRLVTDAFPDEFVAWRATLPPETEVELSPELAGLFGAPVRTHVSLSLAAAPDADQDWFDLSVGLKADDTKLGPEEVALLLRAGGKWVNLPRHGWRRAAAAPEMDPATAAALDRLGLSIVDVAETTRGARHRLHALQLALEAEALAAHDNVLAHAIQDRARRLAAVPPAPLPAGLRAELRPYQKEGYQFLHHLAARGFGGVLADDMGLGKTVQTLAWLLHLAETPREPGAPRFRALVVCPKSVTHGWLAETGRFAPGFTITAFSPGRKLPVVPGPSILVVNYTQLRLQAARLRAEPWDAVVLDEGQFIKNPGSQVAIAARALRARRRVVLTGTPIENRLADLWSLFAFAQPGLLGDQPAFRRQYPEQDPEALARLHRRVRHFLLRRTKAQAAPDLPARTEDEIVVELEGEQRRLYDAELKRARAQLLGVETKSALDAVRFHVLASLLRLRQICCHPALVDGAHAALPSAKLDALLERIEELAEEGHQVLVFSQFVEMLEIIRARLAKTGVGHLILTGATENRSELVNTFQTDPSKTVFLLSLKAAGFGLNLTAASYAFLFDPWWNPAAEAQAIDRIHRIGQTRPVTAYRLIAAGTVEEKIRRLQREKAALAEAVIQEESLAAVLDLDSLRRILT